MPDGDCGGCGSTAAERLKNKPGETQEVRECPHCYSDKCCMCDMGDDVECGNCPDEGE
ncbi:hypothetical protein [Pseudaquabacterium pictum]|nr:hypothetical protein [Rubrivivax pictus]